MNRTRGLLMSVTLALLVVAPASADADLTWHPQTLSVSESPADFARVAANDKGDAVAVWRIKVGNTWRVQASLRSAGGNFSPDAVTLEQISATSPANNTEWGPRVAIDAQGDAVAVWWYGVPVPGGHRNYKLQYAYRPAGGSFGAPQNITSGDLRAPEVAMDAAGNATVLWRQDISNTRDEARVAKKAAGSATFGGFTTISANSSGPTGEDVEVRPEGDTEEQDVNRVSLVMDPQGRTLAVWTATLGGTPYVRVAYRATATGNFDAPVTVSPGNSFNPSAAFDPQGNAIVTWSTVGISGSSAQYAFRSATTGFAAPQTLGPTSGNADPKVAFDPAGGALTVFESNGVPVAAYRPAGGSFGSSIPIAPSGGTIHELRVAVDGQGNAVAIWLADNGQDQVAQAAYRPAGAGAAFGTAAAISDPGDMPNPLTGDSPALTMNANGEAFAVWSRSDGTALRVQASVGLPPSAPPPPPPPPPPDPPVPSAIQPAESFRRSEAIVLSVNITGRADRVVWSFGGKAPTVEGDVVNGALQQSVRLHPDPGDTFSATATVTGPGGTRTFTRTFTIPKALADSDVAKVLHAGDRFSPRVDVVAAGFTDALLGKTSSCSPMTVVAGVQKLSGCLKPVEDITDIPNVERGILKPLADQLHLDEANSELMKKAVAFSDGYIAQGTALLNDQWPVIPSGAAKILSFPVANALTSSSASIEVAGVKFGASNKGFSLDFDPKKAGIDLGALPKPPRLPSIGGFELVGDWDIDLGKQEATIKASLKLPSFITSAGVQIQNSVTLRATPDRLIVDNVSIGPIKVDLAGLGITGFKISYDRPTDTWTGQGKVCLFNGLCIDMVPPNGEVKIKDGRLDFAGASVNFPLPGVPLFTGVNLQRIGFGLGLDPTRMTGNALIQVVDLVRLDGRLVIAFPSARTPFILRADEVGGGFPAKLYGVKFTGPTIGATAGLTVTIPELGDIQLGSGYFLASYPNYIAIGGGADIKVFDVIELQGSIAGEANIGDRVFNLHGDISACLLLVTKICASAVGNISHGPNAAGGAGACLGVGPFHVGGGVQWAHPTKPKIWPFDGCKWSPFKLDVRAARAAQAGASETVVVKRGQPSPAIQLDGQGGAPLVRVTGPGGQSLDSTDKGLDTSPGGKIRILRYQNLSSGSTIVGLQNATPGTYTIAPILSSVPITAVSRTTDPPNAKATGTVTGHGLKRVLSYDVTARPDQTVTFSEIAGGGAAKTIGTITGGGKGHLSFTSAPGASRRTIVAQFALDRIPAERKTVATFMPASPTLGPPSGLRVTRRKTTLTISWHGAAGATRYEIAVTSPTGYQRFQTTAKRRLVVRVPTSVGGKVTVRATDALRQSQTTVHTFKRTAAPIRTITSLARCNVGKHKVSCTKR